MVRRITEKPFPIRAVVVESGANTFTEVDITLPIAPVLGRGQLQAIELMTLTYELDPADPEAGQDNAVSLQLTKDSQIAALDISSEQVIWKQKRTTRVVEVSAVGEIIQQIDEISTEDLTDRDGNGRIIAEQTIHLGIVGAGNAGAKAGRIFGQAHLVSLDADDAIVLLLEAS